MRILLLLLVVLLPIVPARADVVDEAFEAAFVAYERAYPQLGTTEAGVDTAAYRDALSLQTFTAPFWGRSLALDVVRGSGEGDCNRFAAYVRLPPQEGTVPLVICPQFTQSGTAELRRLTVLHEIVHAVAGPSECQAMAFAARVEQLATGAFTPVERYWQANDCDSSGYRLP